MSFTIQVQTPVPVKDDMDINITIPDDQKVSMKRCLLLH